MKPKKAHVICNAENGKPFAVVTGKKPTRFKNNPDVVCKRSEDFVAGLTALSEAIEGEGGKIHLLPPGRSEEARLLSGVHVRYDLPESSNSKKSVLSDYIPSETYNSLDDLLGDSSASCTCKVQVYEYSIYAD